MSYTRKDYSGTRASTTLSAGIDASVTSISITSSTGWPAGTNGSFYAVIDPDTASEEKVLITSRTGTTLNTVTRGVDGSSAAAHSSGATLYPCFSATDADEANYWVAELHGAAPGTGRLLVTNGADSLTGLAASTAGKIPVSDGTTFAQVAVSGDATLASSGALTIANNAVTNAKAAAMTRGTIKVGNASGAASDLALGTSGYYLKSDGTDAVWASVATSDWTTVTKGGDESVSSSTTLQNDNELLFTATNGTPYEVEFALVYTSTSATPGFQLGVGEDGTNRGTFQMSGYNAGPSNFVFVADQGQGALMETFANRLVVVAGRGGYTGAGGTFYIRWAQQTSNATATTVKAGSILKYRALT